MVSSDVALGAMKALVLLFAMGVIYIIWKLLTRTTSYVSKKVTDKTSDIIQKHKINNKYYADAELEVESGNVDLGTWSKALVNAHGNEELRKVEYIKLRAKQLQNGE